MKKLISAILALALCCMLIPAMAEDDLTGEWYASFAGIPVTLTINADGTLSMTSPQGGEASPGTWTLEGDKLTLTIADSPATATVTADGIAMSESGMDLLFTREPIAAITIAEVKAGAAADEYYGVWTLAYMDADGMIIDPSSVGMVFPDVKLGEGTVEFVAASEDDLFAAMFNMMALTDTYEDGALILSATAAGASASGKVEMLEDGMIKLTLDSEDGPMVLYYRPAEAPAA